MSVVLTPQVRGSLIAYTRVLRDIRGLWDSGRSTPWRLSAQRTRKTRASPLSWEPKGGRERLTSFCNTSLFSPFLLSL